MRHPPVVVALAALALWPACRSDDAPCARAVRGALARGLRDAAATRTPDEVARASKASLRLEPLLVERCTGDRWPAAVLACLEAAGTQAAIDACDGGLSDAQRAAKARAVDAVGRAVAPGL